MLKAVWICTFYGFFMICLVIVQILGKGTLSRGEGAAEGGEVLLDILSGGKWILWERSFPGESGGWGKQWRTNRKKEVIVDFRKEGWLTNPYQLCILQFILRFYTYFCVIFLKKGFQINSGQVYHLFISFWRVTFSMKMGNKLSTDFFNY